MAISTVIMLRRMITPISPTAKRVPESIRYASVLGMISVILSGAKDLEIRPSSAI